MQTIKRYPNGLTLVLAPMPHMASVSLGFWAAVGGRHEPAELNGVSHFIEHLLFKGTRRRNARQISEAVEGVGGYVNAFTSEEHTCFYAKASGHRFPEVFDVLADMYLHSMFAPAEMEKERGVIKEEVAMYLDQPQQFVEELLNATQWPDQPLGRPLTGTERTVDAIRRRELLGYFQQHYHAGNTVIAVAGAFESGQVEQSVRRFVRYLRPGARSSFVRATWKQTVPEVRLNSKPSEQTHLALGIRTCSRHDPRRYALRLLNVLVGESMSSRLFQVVREDSGLVYSIYSAISTFDDVGDLVISAGLDTERLPQVLRLIVRELRRLRQSAPSVRELRRARDYVLGQIDLSLENTESTMNWGAEQFLGYGRLSSPDEVKRGLTEVRPAEIRALAQDFFTPSRLNLAVVSPQKRKRGWREILTAVAG